FSCGEIPYFCDDAPTTAFCTLSLHDALPIYEPKGLVPAQAVRSVGSSSPCSRLTGTSVGLTFRSTTSRSMTTCSMSLRDGRSYRSEEHTSELQSRENLVCRLLLEKKKDGRETDYEMPAHPRRPPAARSDASGRPRAPQAPLAPRALARPAPSSDVQA